MTEGILVVVRPFAGHSPGDLIDNPTQMVAVLGSEHAHHVVRVAGFGPVVPHGREV